jgi:hypothetical protein
MPNLDGLGLCDQILREGPAIKVLLMSGSDGPVGVPFLREPFKLEELTQKVRQLLAGDAHATPETTTSCPPMSCCRSRSPSGCGRRGARHDA